MLQRVPMWLEWERTQTQEMSPETELGANSKAKLTKQKFPSRTGGHLKGFGGTRFGQTCISTCRK